MVLDEASEVIKSVCHSNSNAIALILLPVDHASIHHVTVVKNRRSLEDRLMQILVAFRHVFVKLFILSAQLVRSQVGCYQ